MIYSLIQDFANIVVKVICSVQISTHIQKCDQILEKEGSYLELKADKECIHMENIYFFKKSEK